MQKVSYKEFHKWAMKCKWLLLSESAQGVGITHHSYVTPTGLQVRVEAYIGLVKNCWRAETKL